MVRSSCRKSGRPSKGPKWSDWIIPPPLHEATWKAWKAQSSTRSEPRTTSVTGFLDLPLELRNKIYFHAVEKLPPLTILPGSSCPHNQHNDLSTCPDGVAAWLRDLPNRLPHSLNLNRQIRAQAIAELQHHGLQLVTHLTVPTPEDFLTLLPPNNSFLIIRHLTLTAGYKILDETPTPSIPSIKTLISRAPYLTILSTPVPAADLETFYDLVFAHETITEVYIACKLAALDVAVASEKSFLAECKKRNRTIALEIDLWPGRTKYVCEETECWEGGVRYIRRDCWFG